MSGSGKERADGGGANPPPDTGQSLLDPALLAAADALVAGLAESYLGWVRDDLDRVAGLIAELRALARTERQAASRRLFLAAHDLKGQGGSFGFDLMTSVGNSLCRFVESEDRWDEGALDIAAAHLSAMERIVGERLTGAGGAAGADILARLHQVKTARPG